MDSTFPQELLDLKIRVDHWRITRRFIRKPSVIRREISMPLLYPPLRTHFTSPEEIYGFQFSAGSA